MLVLMIFMILIVTGFISVKTQDNSLVPGPITVAIIASSYPSKDDRIHTLGNQHAKQFISTIFNNHQIKDRQTWPPVYTGNCPGVRLKDPTSFNKQHVEGFQRGLILAHRQIWEQFYKDNEDILKFNLSTYASPKIVIFEEDVMEIDPRAPELAYQSVQNMTTDLLYLGHCYDRNPGQIPPECSHAYALTVAGCKAFLHHVEQCGRNGFVDQQFKAIAANGHLTWAALPASFPFGVSDFYVQNNSAELGYTVEYGNQAGGLFHQVRFDNIVPLEEGKLYRGQWPFHKQTYLYKNASLHRFPDFNTFAAMGFDFDINPVAEIPHFQLLRSEGEVLPYK